MFDVVVKFERLILLCYAFLVLFAFCIPEKIPMGFSPIVMFFSLGDKMLVRESALHLIRGPPTKSNYVPS